MMHVEYITKNSNKLSGTITINGAGTDDNAKRLDERNKGVMFKSAPLHSSLTVKAE